MHPMPQLRCLTRLVLPLRRVLRYRASRRDGSSRRSHWARFRGWFDPVVKTFREGTAAPSAAQLQEQHGSQFHTWPTPDLKINSAAANQISQRSSDGERSAVDRHST